MTRGVSVLHEQSGNSGLKNGDLLLIQAVETLQETNIYLKSISTTAERTLDFTKKVVPWGIAIAAVLWPSIGKIIDHLSTLLH